MNTDIENSKKQENEDSERVRQSVARLQRRAALLRILSLIAYLSVRAGALLILVVLGVPALNALTGWKINIFFIDSAWILGWGVVLWLIGVFLGNLSKELIKKQGI